LVHHLIENWSNAFLSKSWISHTNDRFEVVTSEDGLLFLNITELLVLNENLKTIFTGNNFESIVGMAYPALAEKGVTPVFDEMMDQKLL
jgi:hypothetical protein